MNLLKLIVSKMIHKPSPEPDIVKSHVTPHGRVYIKEAEFFSLPKVKEMIRKSLNSDIYKQIEARKRALKGL